MDSSRLDCPLPTEEQTDSKLPVLSKRSELWDINSETRSLKNCCSDDARSLPPPVEGYSSSLAAVQSRSSDDANSATYMRLARQSSNNSCPHSPREYEFPESPSSYPSILLSCPPSWLQGQLEDEATENHQVPLSSSPPEFTSSSPTSDISSELEKEEGTSSLTSASSDARSDTASISASQYFECGPRPDQFSQRLHELLLLVLRGRELERSRRTHEETDCTTCTSPSDDSGSSGTDFEHSGNGHQGVVAKTRASTPPIRTDIHSPTIISKWFSDQGFVSQASKQSNDTSSRSSTSLSYLSNGSPSNDQATQENIDDIGDISPIRFEIPSNGTSQFLANAATATAEAYRVIKRSRSSSQFQDTLMPHAKRQKTQGQEGQEGHSGHARDRRFATRTASLRRADSLKSIQAVGDGKTPTQTGCIATVPVTPVPISHRVIRRKSATSTKALKSPVPIIAPPFDYVPKLPLSAETLAKIRLGKFLEREGRGREKDGLPVSGWERPLPWVGSDDDDEETFEVREKPIEWEVALGIGQRAREEVIDWILDVMPTPVLKKKDNSATSATSSASGSLSSSRTSSSTSSSISMDRKPSDLMDQLKNSPETRFHAAWMFLRYFYLTMSPNLNVGPSDNARNLSRQSSLNSNISASTDQEGRDLIIWDIAVASLALSVKFHRDFLDPLLPVYAHEYLSLAPHRLSYEDLETAQRDVLSAFDYFLGVTPQPVMDELWFSLESLRSLLSFENGWQTAMSDAWCGLFDAICQPDVQRFSISTLAAVALMDGVVESLVQRYLYEATLKIKAAVAASIFNSTSLIARENRRRRRRGSNRDSLDRRHELEFVAPSNMEMGTKLKGLNRNRKKYLRKAERASEGVRCDIQALVGITDAQLRNCRDWFSGIR